VNYCVVRLHMIYFLYSNKFQYHQKLTHDEFLELLGMVIKTSLAEIDPQLMPFQNMSLLWFKSLYKVLQSKYQETHRCFSSLDGLEPIDHRCGSFS
jgi:hypothetical protein